MDLSPEELADLEFSVREWSGLDAPFYWGTVTHTPSKLYAMGVGTSALEAMAKALEKYRKREVSKPPTTFPAPPVSMAYLNKLDPPVVYKSSLFDAYEPGINNLLWSIDTV